MINTIILIMLAIMLFVISYAALAYTIVYKPYEKDTEEK